MLQIGRLLSKRQSVTLGRSTLSNFHSFNSASFSSPVLYNAHGRLLQASSLTQTSLRFKSVTSSSTKTDEQPQDKFNIYAEFKKVELDQTLKPRILKKTNQGRQLALQVSDKKVEVGEHIQSGAKANSEKLKQSQNERFERQQRFQMFVEKMMQLQRSQTRLRRKQKHAYVRMEMSPVQSMTPIKFCLQEYSKLSNSGFDCSVLATSLKLLNQVVAAGGNEPISMNDYTMSELDQSWRLDKITEDVRFGLDPNPNRFFSPYNMAQVSRELGTLGYKNTELFPLWFDKIEAMMEKMTTQNYVEGAKVSFEQAQFGSAQNFIPRHYIYQGFGSSEEFRQHVDTLLEYQQQKDADSTVKTTAEYKELKSAAETLINAAKEVKELQKDVDAAVRNVRTQYQRLKEARDEHAFLQENKYISFDLLELQELLIKGGYLHPEEKPLGRLGSDQQFVGTLGMDAAVEVFYDMLNNQYPEILSPNYDQFYDAAMINENQFSANSKDLYTDLNIHTLSSTLVGLEQQAMSYRRDIVDRDYPTEFYEQLMHPEEKWADRAEHMLTQEQKLIAKNMQQIYVPMERTYLNAWQTFKDRTQKIPQVIEQMLKGDLTQEDLYSSLRALNICRFQAEKLRDKIGTRFKKIKKNHGKKVELQALVDGAVGLAGCTYKFEGMQNMKSTLLKTMKNERTLNALSFPQAVELLKALTTPGMASEQTELIQIVRILVNRINSMKFDIIQNELNFTEFEQLYDSYVNMKYSSVEELHDLWQNSFKDESLRSAFDKQSFAKNFYPEHHAAKFDPIKPRVIGAFTQSLVHADLKDLHVIQQGEEDGLNRDLFPYKPDILMSHAGKKIGIFVLKEDESMRDTYEPCGFTKGKMRLIQQAHEKAGKQFGNLIRNVPLAVQSVVEADLKNHKLSLREDFNIKTYLKSNGLGRASESAIHRSCQRMTDFTANLMSLAVEQASTTSVELEEFLSALLVLQQKHDKLYSVFEHEQVLNAIDEIKLELIKILSVHERSLSLHDKKLVMQSLPQGGSRKFDNFSNFVERSLINPLLRTQKFIEKHVPKKESKKSNYTWQGTRQSVELPSNKAQLDDLQPKSILPELLSQNFLWYDSYHQYDDWESQMRQAYDQLNLMQLPATNLYFNKNDFNRRVPKGIFPDARRPRTILRPPGTKLSIDTKELNSMHDEMTKFERNPIQTMLKTELQKNAQLAANEVPAEVRTITNLQNIKHSMKSDLDDHQICDFLLNKLSFTDLLIEAHLNLKNSKGEESQAKFIKRDAENYRNFVNEFLRTQRNFVAPYDHFYMQEAQRKGNPEEIAEQIFQLEQEHLVRPLEEYYAKKQALEKQLEDLLLNYERANEDPFNLSHALANKVKVSIDLDSLTPVKARNQQGLRAVELEINPEDFLKRQRCRAEANLIKARIAYKVHNDLGLTNNETKYLKAWCNGSKDSKTLLPDADILVPQNPSSLSLNQALSAEDFYFFNSLSRVDIAPSERNHISLNDLVLELSLFIDNETVRQIELGLVEDSMRSKWQLGKKFKIASRRNKEIDLVMKEVEEVAWRAASQFNDTEQKQIEELVFFDRGLDAFDNEFLDIDRASFANFFNEANCYDSRVNLLENWLCRKDEEVRKRVVLPLPQMAKPDHELHAYMDAPLKRARENLVGQMLTTDEFGESRSSKQYTELTTRELHLLVEGLCVRLDLFQKKYPAFLPQVVRAVMEHKNLAGSDRSMLGIYCKLFELDWRGDKNIDNREQFMFTNPIYMHEKDKTNLKPYSITNKSITRQIRQACQSYMPELLTKFRQLVKTSKQTK